MKQTYVQRGVTLTPEQARKIVNAHKNGSSVKIRLSKANLHGSHQLPLTQTQAKRMQNATGGVELNLSKSQLQSMNKTGGFLPLLGLIPAALGAVGGLAAGISNIVSSAKQTAEQARHNKAMEEIERAKSGSGVISDTVTRVPLLGNILGPLLEKIGLGVNEIKTLNKCDCEFKKLGYGLYLAPEGEGLFLGPEKKE